MNQRNYLSECELDAALAQSQSDVAAGRYIAESAQQHMARLDALLAPEAEEASQRAFDAVANLRASRNGVSPGRLSSRDLIREGRR